MSFDRMDLRKADYNHWNYVAFVTLNEFIYLAAGCEPLHVGTYGNDYLNLTNNEVKEFYKKVSRLGEELPWTTTKETEVHGSLKPEPKYEAIYLIRWVKSRNIPVNSNYKPIMSDERIRTNHLNKMRGMDIVSINDFAIFLAAFNPHIENGAKHFKDMLLGAIQVGKITPINNSYSDDVPLEERDYKFNLSSLIMFSKEKELNIPTDSFSITDEKKKSGNNCPLNGDEINPNRLSSMLLMILTMAVTKYSYNHNSSRNKATGDSAGSIRVHAQELGSKLNREDLNFDINEGTVKSIIEEAVNKYLI